MCSYSVISILLSVSLSGVGVCRNSGRLSPYIFRVSDKGCNSSYAVAGWAVDDHGDNLRQAWKCSSEMVAVCSGMVHLNGGWCGSRG